MALVSAVSRPVAFGARGKRKRRPGCGADCRQLGIPQGTGGAFCAARPWLTEASVEASKTLRLPVAENYPRNAGDLLLAAIVTEGGAITPPLGWTEVPDTDHSSGAGDRLQVFYKIPVPLSAPHTARASAYSFTAPDAQAITGTLTDFEGVSQSDPINASAGEANASSSSSVTAHSVTNAAETGPSESGCLLGRWLTGCAHITIRGSWERWSRSCFRWPRMSGGTKRSTGPGA